MGMLLVMCVVFIYREKLMLMVSILVGSLSSSSVSRWLVSWVLSRIRV